MKNIILLTILLMNLQVFSQKNENILSEKKPYSENSKIKVIYKDSVKDFHNLNKKYATFVNGNFVGNGYVMSFINPKKIESVKVENVEFKRNGKEYYGKALIKMKSEYLPKIISLENLISKYLNLNSKPFVIQIDKNIFSEYNEKFIDENFILKIEVEKIKTSENELEINLIKIITKTTKNIKTANTIAIKQNEN